MVTDFLSFNEVSATRSAGRAKISWKFRCRKPRYRLNGLGLLFRIGSLGLLGLLISPGSLPTSWIY